MNDKYQKGYIRVREGGLYWRSFMRGLTPDKADAFLYTRGEFEEANKQAGGTLEFEPAGDLK